MSQMIHHKIVQLTQSRLVNILLFSIWLFSASISMVHAQEHILSTDNSCQICLSNFNHTPFIHSNNVFIVPLIQNSFVEVKLNTFIAACYQLNIGNRDPPIC